MGKRILYHYTRQENLFPILTYGLLPSIRVLDEASSDAQHGDGHYFTDLTPQEVEQFTRAQVSQALFMTPRKWGTRGQVATIVWISFDLEEAEVVRVTGLFPSKVRSLFPNRGIWLHRSTTTLPTHYITADGTITFEPMRNGTR